MALLDLISAAAEAPKVVRERAHELAQDHQVAAADQVERALAKILPASDPYAWDRPDSITAHQAILEHARSEQADVAKARKRYYGGWRGFIPDGVFESFALFFLLNVPLFLGISCWVLLTIRVPSSLLQWFVTDVGVGLALLAMIPWGRKRKTAFEKAVPNAQERVKKARSAMANLASHSPTSEQMAQWLSFPEVAKQARTWIGSPCGLMAADARRLDARVQALQETTERDVRANLAAQLGLPV